MEQYLSTHGGIHKNGPLFIDHVLSKHSIICVQETKFHDRTRRNSFQLLLKSKLQHRRFVNDANSILPHPTQIRCMRILRSDILGYPTAGALEEGSIRNRFLVVRFHIHDALVYIHNAYAPVRADESFLFFEQLLSPIFASNSTHIVLGDLNTPPDPAIDASSKAIRHESSRLASLEWLSQLGVLDAWRIQHPTEKLFIGPLPSKIFQDYICMLDELFRMVYKDSDYFRPRHAGDHMAHRVYFANTTQPPGRDYWKCSLPLFKYPQLVEAIKTEAILVPEQLRTASNPGIMWIKMDDKNQKAASIDRQKNCTG